jgi:fatty-acyl-CoA synthase
MTDYGIGSWPARRARISGSAIALRQADRSLTYTELAHRVERLAGALASHGGVRHGDRVAYLGLNDIATFEVFFAAGRLGALFVPLNTRLTAAEIGYLLDDARPAALFYGPELAGVVAETDPAARGVGLVIPVAGSGPGSYADLIDGPGRPGSLPADAVPQDAVPQDAGPQDAGPQDAGPQDVGLEDAAVILYTSGTTGRPKGAVLSHGNLTFNAMNQLAHADVLSSDTALCMCPLFHATGLCQVSLPTIFKGGTVVVLPQFAAGTVLELISALGVASFSAVPTMLQMLCDHPGFAAADLSSLRFVMYGGSMVAERVAVAWQRCGVQVLQGYGMTEASPGVCLAVADGAAERPVSVGVPHFFTDISLAAPGAGAATGQTGELLVRGLNVFRGYWERPAESQSAFAGGWFRSGDVLRISGDGWAYVVDRVKDMIISGGENVYPAEVEAAINALPGVAGSGVIAYPDELWGEVGLAFVVAEPGAWTAESLRAALARSLAAFKVPRQVRFVADLPRTATGKVRKQDLRAVIAAEQGHGQGG